MKRTVLLALLCAATAFAAPAASLVEGRIYLKNGTVVECTGNDRIKLPKKSGPLKLFRDAFRRTKTKEVFRADSVDSVVCWHPKTPEYLRKFIPAADPGWMWVYLETPHIRVCVWSKKGYGIDTDGGIQIWQKQRTFSQSRTAYVLQKHGGDGFRDVGGANRNSKDAFRERVARYVDDDPALAERIRHSNASRSKTVLMLQDYNPTKR